MKVLNFIPSPDFGGPHKRVLNIAKELEQRGVTTEVLLPSSEDGDAKSYFENEGIKVHEISFVPPIDEISKRLIDHLWYSFTSLPAIVKILKSQEIDIFHVNGFFLLSGLIAGKLSPSKVLLHLNDMVLPKIFIKILKGLTYRLADRIVASAGAVAEYYEAPRFDILYPPVDTDVFNPDNVIDVAEGMSFPHEITIGIVANINPAKGLEYFIEAIYELVEEGYKVNGVIVGGVIGSRKKYYGKLRDLVKQRGLEDYIFFMGKQSNIPAYLAQFDVFVLSSISEACPVTLLEAMAMGIPIVAADIGGVSETLKNGEAGFLVSPRSPDEIADAIRRYLSSPKAMRENSTRARYIVENIFSVENIANKYHAILESLVNSG